MFFHKAGLRESFLFGSEKLVVCKAQAQTNEGDPQRATYKDHLDLALIHLRNHFGNGWQPTTRHLICGPTCPSTIYPHRPIIVGAKFSAKDSAALVLIPLIICDGLS